MLATDNRNSVLPLAALLLGASIWGVVWYPIRILEQNGVSGPLSTTIAYFIALIIGVLLFHRQLRYRIVFDGNGHLLFWICFFAGWTNIAYILAIISGEIARVLLLFYLSPLWTILFARLLLNEKLTLRGYVVMMLSIAGAITMLWHPGALLPLPVTYADWMGLLGGVMFALVNVLIRKDQTHSVELKSIAIWLGSAVIGLMCTLLLTGPIDFPTIAPQSWLLLLAIGGVMFLLSILVQYGLTYTPANRAIIILMVELAVAAVAAYFLAGETLSWREFAGGGMIIAAGIFSAKLSRFAPDESDEPGAPQHDPS